MVVHSFGVRRAAPCVLVTTCPLAAQLNVERAVGFDVSPASFGKHEELVLVSEVKGGEEATTRKSRPVGDVRAAVEFAPSNELAVAHKYVHQPVDLSLSWCAVSHVDFDQAHVSNPCQCECHAPSIQKKGKARNTIELRCRAGRRRVIFHSSMGEPPLFLFGKRRVGAVAGGDTIWL